MEGWKLLLDLIVVLAAAFIGGLIFEKLRLGAVVGYILAGILIGPSAMGVVESLPTVQGLAELGIALLLFTTGLEFSMVRLRKLGKSTLFAGLAQLIVCLAVFTGIGMAFGMELRGAVAMGAIVSVSSTAIVLRVLRERGDLDAGYGKTSFGILLIQDIALVPLVLLVTLLGQGDGSRFTLNSMVPAVGGFIATALIFILVVSRLLPRAFRSRAMATNRELPIVLAIVTCTGSAWAAHAIGLSPSLGAFLAGVLLAETSFEQQIRSDLAGLKALFGTIFFASVGMLLNVQWVGAHIPAVVMATLVVLIGKALANFAAIRSFKRTTISSAAAAIALAQIGELGFILLQIAVVGRALTEDQGNLLTAVAVASMIASPFIVGAAPQLARGLAKTLVNKRKLVEEETVASAEALSKHFIVLGFGTAGRTATRILGEAQYSVVVVDVDPKFAKRAKELGAIPWVGDATGPDLLEELHLNDALGLIVALPDHRSATLAIGHARRLSPGLQIVARARVHQFQDDLREAGADLVIGEEELLGRRLGEESARLALGKIDEDVVEAL